MLNDPGVDPEVGATTSQPAEDEAVYGMPEPLMEDTDRVCAGGAEPPHAAEKLITLASRERGAVTLRVTGTVCGPFEDPDAFTVTEPLYVPGVSPLRFTDTLSVPGVDPLNGVTTSQLGVDEMK